MSDVGSLKSGTNRNLPRRDFLNGVAVGTGGAMAGSVLPDFAWQALAPSSEPQDQPGYYPPALTGMRGSHAGSFEAAHGVRDGKFPAKGASPNYAKETYDLVIVRRGIRGHAET